MLINPFEITKIVKLSYGVLGPIYIEIPISDTATQTTWVSEGVTMNYLQGRINEISGDYFSDFTRTTRTTSTSATSLNKIENNCYNYPLTNVLYGFGIGIILIILLLLINLIVMISKKRSNYRTRMENISGESIRFPEMFSDLNRPRQQQQQHT